MPLDTQEGIGLALQGLPIGNNILAAVNAFNAIPPEERTALHVAPIIGVTKGPVFRALEAAATPADFKISDVIGILELDANGNLALVLSLAQHALEEIKD